MFDVKEFLNSLLRRNGKETGWGRGGEGRGGEGSGRVTIIILNLVFQPIYYTWTVII